MTFEGKWALVTGSGRTGRVGATIAKRMASEGANVYLHFRPGGETEAESVRLEVLEAGSEFGIQVVLISADLGNSDDIIKTFAATMPTPDIVIHNAAVFKPADIPEDANLEDTVKGHEKAFDANIDANLRPLILVTEAAIHQLKAQGRVGTFVFIGDAYIDNGGVYDKNLAAYTVSKAAARMLARHFAEAYGRDGFKFFAVLNGPIEPPPSASEEAVEEIANEIPMPKEQLTENGWIGAEAVAAAIVHGIKMTKEAGFNGGAITVDGGRAWTTADEH